MHPRATFDNLGRRPTRKRSSPSSAVGRNASFSALTFSQKYFCRFVVAPFGDGLGRGTNSIVEEASISNLAGLVVAGVRKRLILQNNTLNQVPLNQAVATCFPVVRGFGRG